MSILKEQLKFEEGFRSIRYICRAGKVTIGYGHNCDAEPTFHGKKIPARITRGYAEELLEHDIERTIAGLRKRWPRFDEFDQARKDAFINMAFQMGVEGFMGFDKMRYAALARDWSTAYKEALNSKWAKKDTPARARRVAWQIRHGKTYTFPHADT